MGSRGDGSQKNIFSIQTFKIQALLDSVDK
jgi:hypothetical protein